MTDFQNMMYKYVKELKNLNITECTMEVGVGKYYLIVEDFNNYMKEINAVYIMNEDDNYNGEDSFIVEFCGIRFKFKIDKS